MGARGGGTQQRVRKSLSWEMLRGMEGMANGCGVGGREAWIGMTLSYFMLLRALELFAKDDSRVHTI